jgi:integrase
MEGAIATDGRPGCDIIAETAHGPTRIAVTGMRHGPVLSQARLPNGAGKVESHANFCNRGWYPLQIAAGLTKDTGKKDAASQPILRAKYGFRCLRHFFASWLLAEGFSLKKAQGLLGHATMAMTADTYGHLLPDLENDAAKMAAGELALVG